MAVQPSLLWAILAVVLAAAEMLVPGTFLLWLGAAAAVTALLSFLLAPGWQAEALVFAAAAVVAVIAGRRFYAHMADMQPVDHPLLNQRAAQLIGQRFTLDTAILQGRGRLRVGDSTWSVRGPDRPAGSVVTVTGVDGIVLTVE